MTVTLTVDGREVTVSDGASVLDAVNASETYVSQLCKDPDMKPIGSCRTCLVQVDGMRGYPASCSVPAAEGLTVRTDTPEVRHIRAGVIELTLAMVEPSEEVGPKGSFHKRSSLSQSTDGTEDHRELTIAAEHHGIASTRWTGRRREPSHSERA